MTKSNCIILFILVLLFESINIFGQTKVLLNNKEVDLMNKVYLNPIRIDSCFVVKVDASKKEFHIITKKQKFTYFSLSYILKNYTDVNLLKSPVLYKINGRILDDTTNIQIDDTYQIYVRTEKLSNVKYIPKKMRNLTIVRISLGAKEAEPALYIRSNQDLIDKLKIK